MGLELRLRNKYMSGGYYFIFTGATFSSRYKFGDGIWRNTRYNRKDLFNLFGGKDWMVGKSCINVFEANARVSLGGVGL